MKYKRIIYIVISFLVIGFIGYKLFLSINNKRIRENALKIARQDMNLAKQTIDKYYLGLENSKFNDSLNSVDYSNDKTKETDQKWLNENKNDYVIGYSNSQGGFVSFTYSIEKKQYRISTSIRLQDKISKIEKMINEEIYLKKIDSDYKIVHISSYDTNLKYRCSNYDNTPEFVYDKGNYKAIKAND
ncbi:hypothetical protein [Desnuesiella massiliensis]|uniref:hypothetical protein n=1 Tax=Desnuesiella massiliensis TaxID=1650662 RepID=UPI0006E42A16|nr:hypothetical protein [Desnuesiella massiliensis]